MDTLEAELTAALEGTTEPTPAPDPTPAPEPTPEPTPEPEPDFSSGTALMEYFGELTGVDAKGKYKSDLDFLNGVGELHKTIGRRDDDAALGRRLRENPGAVFQEYGFHQQPQQPQPVQQQPQTSYDDYKRLQGMIQLDESGNMVPKPGAPLDAVERYREASDAMQRAAYNMAMNPNKIYGDVAAIVAQQIIPQATAQAQQVVQQNQKVQAETQEAIAWAQSKKEHLYNGGDMSRGLSPIGIQLANKAEELGLNAMVKAGTLTPARALEFAWGSLIANLPTPKPQQTPSPHAMPKPNVANSPDSAPDPVEPRAGESMESWIQRVTEMGLLK